MAKYQFVKQPDVDNYDIKDTGISFTINNTETIYSTLQVITAKGIIRCIKEDSSRVDIYKNGTWYLQDGSITDVPTIIDIDVETLLAVTKEWFLANTESVIPTLTFKHFYDAGTIGSGTVKFRHYSQTEPTPPTPAYTDCLTFTGETGEFTLKAKNKTWDGTLEWSTDHTNWTTLAGTGVMQSVGKKLYLRGKGNTKFYDSGSYKGINWILSEKAGCSGNIQTLLDWENPPTAINTMRCYYNMFAECTNLTSAPELPATTLATYCYEAMFLRCTNLAKAPKLPATTLAAFCYRQMFYDCVNLTAPPELPATTLADSCYADMFRNCTNLATAPELPATTLATFCYDYMFAACKALKVPPKLPAVTVLEACYRGMFNGCTSLTAAPALPATTIATDCYSSMFSGCTSITSPPKLPAVKLREGCYHYMFSNCTNLISAPSLPATSLGLSCYYGMFYGCKKIKISATQTAEYKTAWRIPSSGTISKTPTWWNTNMLQETGGTFTGSPSINTTYYGAW